MTILRNQGFVDAGNSSTTPLNNAAVYTGTWIDVSAFTDFSVSIKTDQNGTYSVQYSPDASNVDSTLTRYYRTGQIEPPHVFKNCRKYARVVFTNDSGANQTYLRLQSMIGNRGQLNAPCDSTLSQDYDANVVRPTSFNYEVALGRRQGYTTWNKFGYNADVDSGTEIIASFGGTFTPLTTASTLSIVSTSIEDDSAGTGARSVVVYGVDASRNEQTEVVALDGTTPVVTASTWLGINRIAVYVAGSTLNNVGVVTATAVTGGAVQAQMPAGEGTTQQAIFFTQTSHTLLADYLLLNAEKTGGGASPKIRFKGWVYSAVSASKYNVLNVLIDTAADNHMQITPIQPFVISEKSCLWFEATSDTADAFVSCRFSGIEVRAVSAT